MRNLLRKYAKLAVLAGLLAWSFYTISSTTNHAVATTFLSPLQVPEPFLSTPYYGPKRLTANVDHDQLGSDVLNGRVLIFDGRSASSANGWCDGANYNPHIAFWTAPNPPRDCLWYDAHHGNDFNLAYEPVLAAADGNVIRAGWQNWNNRYEGYGLHLRISHANGYETRYGHLSALAVMTNATAYRGQIIGTSGNTGNAFGAPQGGHHIHFEVRLNGQVTDPFGGAGANWLWRDGSWDAQGNRVGQLTPRYGVPPDDEDDDYPEGGTPDNPNFAKGHTIQSPYGPQWEYCPPGQCDYWYRVLVGNDGDMLYTNVNGSVTDYWAMWKPSRASMYDVQVWIPGDNATSWGARYWWLSALNGMPAMYTVIDQWGVTNQWISLGIQSFSSSLGSSGWYGVWTDDKTGEAQAGRNKLGVDALLFRSPWPVYIPIVLKH